MTRLVGVASLGGKATTDRVATGGACCYQAKGLRMFWSGRVGDVFDKLYKYGSRMAGFRHIRLIMIGC